jgi:hypothetical protein
VIYRTAFVSAAALSLALVSVARANVTYSLSPFPNAPTFTGTVVTDGTIGTITTANILNWSYTTGGQTFSGTGADVQLSGAPGALSATTTDILFQAIPGTGGSGMRWFHAPTGAYSDFLLWSVFSGNSMLPPGSSLQHGGILVAQSERFVAVTSSTSITVATVIPAPGSAMALCLIGTGIARRRRR